MVEVRQKVKATAKKKVPRLDLGRVQSETARCAKATLKTEAPLPTDVFELAERAELAVSAIYVQLSRHFRENPELRALFGLLASEEKAHARRVREVANLWRDKGVAVAPCLDTPHLARLTAHAEDLRDQLARADKIDEASAFGLAASMEHDFGVAHAEALTQVHDPLLTMLFEELAKDDQGHAALLARNGEGERS